MVKRKSQKVEDEALCLLVKGQEIIKERWVRGMWGETGGPVCSLGAIGDVYAGNPKYLMGYNHQSTPAFVAAKELASVIRIARDPFDNLSDPTDKIIEWNDMNSRKKSTVVAAFERAIKKRQAKLRKKFEKDI